jgi:type IV fimbrial biogenesis protein FimT
MSVMNKMSGLTLLELIITLTIASILMMIAIPSMKSYSLNDRLRTNVNALIGHLALARSESVKRSQQVSICASNNSITCSGSWDDGWIIYIDADVDNSFTAGEEVIRVQQSLDGSNTLSATGIGMQITYDYRGYAKPGSVGSLLLCDNRSGPYGKTVRIATTGRVRLERESLC